MSVLSEQGFAVVNGPFRASELPALIDAYDQAVASANQADVGEGGTSLRVGGLIDRFRCFDALYTHAPLLEAAAGLIGGDCKLSAFHARSIRPGAPAQHLHQDVKPGKDGWPLVGFIFMIDAFTARNAATRFVPGSETLAELPIGADRSCRHACGAAGAMILFNGSVWHGHGANLTSGWRRSIQGALIPRAATSAVDHASRLGPERRRQLSVLACELLSIEPKPAAARIGPASRTG